MAIGSFIRNLTLSGAALFSRDSNGNITGLKGAAIYPSSIPGAAADGVTIDSAAIANRITAAGNGGTVTLEPGKTYAVDRVIQLLPNQTLMAYGATIKRTAQIITTTTNTITSGTTNSFTVATGTGANFSVGQTISAYNGANYNTQNLTISSIVGDVITTATTFVLSAGSPWSGTTHIVLSFDTIKTDSGVNLKGLSIDGNKANWSYYHWETVAEIASQNGSNFIQDCKINNAPAEGIIENNGSVVTGNRYLNNLITNINGNGVHLSTCSGTQVRGNYIYNTNLDGVNVGHNGGCITISNTASDYIIDSNVLDTGRAGVGQIDSAGNSFFNISNNIMHNMSTYVIEVRGPNVNVTDGIITGNRFYNDTPAASAALIAVDITDTSSGTMQRMTVTGNSFYNVGLVISNVLDSSVTGNTFYVTYSATDTYHDNIKSAGTLTNVVIANNVTKYGNSGITLGSNQTGVVVSGNSCNNAYYYGIYTVGGTSSNVQIVGNNVINDTNVNSSYQAIVTNGNTVIKNNNVNIVAGYCGIRVNGTANVVVQGNTVRASATGKTIRVETGSTGYVVSENQTNYAVVDTPAVGVRVANNDIIV